MIYIWTFSLKIFLSVADMVPSRKLARAVCGSVSNAVTGTIQCGAVWGPFERALGCSLKANRTTVSGYILLMATITKVKRERSPQTTKI